MVRKVKVATAGLTQCLLLPRRPHCHPPATFVASSPIPSLEYGHSLPPSGHNPPPQSKRCGQRSGVPEQPAQQPPWLGRVRISGRVPLCFASTAGKTCVSWNYTKASLQAPPLDFSFRGISFMQDLLTEEPRPGLRPIRRLEGGRLLTQAVRLNNNTLSDLTDFPDIMEKLLEYPLDIYWIDLSFNDLPNIDPVLTTFYNLRNLNLHGNSIQQLSEVDKLAVLPHLRNLTLHGNPIEEEKGYRSYILSTLPQLKNLDFSGITKLDRSTAAVWRRMNIKPKVIRKKRERY